MLRCKITHLQEQSKNLRTSNARHLLKIGKGSQWPISGKRCCRAGSKAFKTLQRFICAASEDVLSLLLLLLLLLLHPPGLLPSYGPALLTVVACNGVEHIRW